MSSIHGMISEPYLKICILCHGFYSEVVKEENTWGTELWWDVNIKMSTEQITCECVGWF
jgi:hypothetical protein